MTDKTKVKKIVREFIMDDNGKPVGARIGFPGIDKEILAFPADFNDEVNAYIWANGAKQKLGDKAASLTKEYTPSECEPAYAAIKELYDTMVAGSWAMTSDGILVEALAKVKGIDAEAARKLLKGVSEKEKKKLHENKKIKVAIAKIRLERAEAGMDDDDDEDDILTGL